MREPIFFRVFPYIFAITFILGVIGVIWNANLMSDCINSGNPNSQECFKYNVVNNNLRNLNITEQ